MAAIPPVVELRIDIATQSAVELELEPNLDYDPATYAQAEERVKLEAAQAVQRTAALNRLRMAALNDPVLSDLLLVLGLE